jgi:hypothetical protein
MKEKQEQINKLLTEAQAKLDEAAKLTVGVDGYFRFDGGTYGMGGWIESGEWQASSNSC